MNQSKQIVITGGTGGFGTALVRQFHKRGHTVLFTSRKLERLEHTLRVLSMSSKKDPEEKRPFQVSRRLHAIESDIATPHGLKTLDTAVRLYLGPVDIWINNAAISDAHTPFRAQNPCDIRQIIDTNLSGSVLGTRLALQANARHVYQVLGAGSDGGATPSFAVYGCTKAAIRQFVRTLRKEIPARQTGIHTLSPGMMPTDLLAKNASELQKKVFNVVCEDPEVVAVELVERMLLVEGGHRDLEYMTVPRILNAMWHHQERQGRFFKS